MSSIPIPTCHYELQFLSEIPNIHPHWTTLRYGKTESELKDVFENTGMGLSKKWRIVIVFDEMVIWSN